MLLEINFGPDLLNWPAAVRARRRCPKRQEFRSMGIAYLPTYIQCCGSGIFTDFFPSRIRTVCIPDPGSASKNLSILTQKWFLSSRKYDLGCSSRITDPDADFLPIPDPGVKKAPDPGSGSATLLFYNWYCPMRKEWIKSGNNWWVFFKAIHAEIFKKIYEDRKCVSVVRIQ